ncbi:MAG: GNAT family N-acetyltransferase [Gammaproteobacteria bacterium]|nr:GNAT family N-acetyltransferase [Gammaproteobacteria bacterium]
MLADDALGAEREDDSQPLNPNYVNAFEEIDRDPNNALIVTEIDGNLVGMLQLTFIPYLTHIGAWRCLVEGVRIHLDYRGRGLGRRFFEWAIDTARQKGCRIIKLTSDKQRPDALRFYESLGFSATHEGFKLKL